MRILLLLALCLCYAGSLAIRVVDEISTLELSKKKKLFTSPQGLFIQVRQPDDAFGDANIEAALVAAGACVEAAAGPRAALFFRSPQVLG